MTPLNVINTTPDFIPMLVMWETQVFKLVVFGETHFKSHNQVYSYSVN